MRIDKRLVTVALTVLMLLSLVPAASGADLDPMAPYDPPITITTALRMVPNQEFANGHSYENTVWTEYYEKELGIKVEYLFSEDNTNYEERLALAINTGNIPDVMRVYDPQILPMYKGGMLYDLTDVFEQYASETLKKEMQQNMDGAYMEGAYFDGRLLMLPFEAESASDWEWPLFIRRDWLDKLGLKPPETIEEFMAVCDAFVNGDPDGNGAKDTYALAVAGKDNLLSDWASLMPFFAAFDAQPGWWFSGQLFYETDESGKIIWSGAKPGVKDALTLLQEMYQKGYLVADFGTVDSGERIVEDICNSKAGMFFGDYWVQWWPLNILKESTPEAEWYATDMPTPSGKMVRQERYQPASSWTVVSSACEHPEAIIKMLSAYVDIWYGMDGNDPRKRAMNAPAGVTDAGMGPCSVTMFHSPSQIEKEYRAMAKAITDGDTSALTDAQEEMYTSIKLFLDDPLANPVGWGAYFTHNPEPGYMNYFIFDVMAKADTYLNNAHMGILTDLMADRFPMYQTMAAEKVTQIIYGQATVESWDDLVSEWAMIGNDEVIAEIESLK